MKLVIKVAYKNAGKCITKQYGLIFFFSPHPAGH